MNYLNYIPNHLGLSGMFTPQSQGGLGLSSLYSGIKQNPANVPNSGIFSDPFGTAMSGNQTGTLQPYVNRMTQNASNALYSGLLNYQPQPMISGGAGGQNISTQVPQVFNIPSALQGMMGGQGLNFGNRSWMKQGGQ
jgi:hypothetical protein